MISRLQQQTGTQLTEPGFALLASMAAASSLQPYTFVANASLQGFRGSFKKIKNIKCIKCAVLLNFMLHTLTK